jgi:hypothetical protein
MKKLNKFFAVLVALAMMATLCVSMAFAEDTVPTGTAASAQLVKYLQKGEGVDTPDATFNFHFAPQDGAPEVADVAIAAADMDADANNDLIGSKTIAEIFADVTFPNAGVYTYTVTELPATYTEADNQTLTINDNGSSYTLRIYVKNDGNGTAIDKVTVEEEGGAKVDPTEKKDTADEGTVDGEDQGFAFTNTFKKDLVDPDQGEDEQDKTGVLDVTKTVTGNYADKTYEFPFELTYTLPSANEGAVKYKVLKKAVTNAADVEEQTATGGKITFALADGDKLIITQAPQGTKWATLEKLEDATCQNANKYQATANGTAFEEGANASTAEAVLTEKTAADYENALEDTDVTPTGILVSNLPYIALALVAIGGLVAYVVVRRRDNENA